MTPAKVWHASPRMPLSLNQRARQMAELDLKTFTHPPPPTPERRGCSVSEDAFVFHTHLVSLCGSVRGGEPGDEIAIIFSLTTTKSPQ